MTFGNILKEYRQKYGYPQKYVAYCFKITQPSYSNLENNILEPKIYHLHRFILLYKPDNVTISKLIKSCLN